MKIKVDDIVLYPDVYGNKEVFIVREMYKHKLKIECTIQNDFHTITHVDIKKLVN